MKTVAEMFELANQRTPKDAPENAVLAMKITFHCAMLAAALEAIESNRVRVEECKAFLEAYGV